jgi:hypothetical protein
MRTIVACVMSMGLGMALVGGFAVAKGDKPAVNTSAKHHPNLNKAQELSRESFNFITKAQEANEFDMDGHAKKAKELLETVNSELKLAAEAANKNAK